MKRNTDSHKSEQELKLMAEHYCMTSEHSVRQVNDKLHEWGVESATAAERIISGLIKDRYIDEQRFASAVVHDKLMFNRWGRVKIRLYLKNQCIDELTINTAMEQIDEKEYVEILRSVVAGKSKSIKATDKWQHDAKLMRSVVQCGFEPELVRSFVSLPEE